MLRDRSIHVICADDAPPRTLLTALHAIRLHGLHVVGLDLWCPEDALQEGRDALWEACGDAPLPPFRSVRCETAPASRVFGVDDAHTERLMERLRTLGGALPEGVVIAGIVGDRASDLREGLVVAMTLQSRTGDVLVRSADLSPFPFVQLASLDLPTATRRLLATLSFSELTTVTRAPPPDELRGRLSRHIRGWTYEARAGDRLLAEASLSDVVGTALAAIVRRPDGTVHEVFEEACAGDLGWTPADRGSSDEPEKVSNRVRVWMRRVRKELADWQAQGLGAFVPQRGQRRIGVSVDIQFDDGLPWRPQD